MGRSSSRIVAIDDDAGASHEPIQRGSIAEIHIDFILWEELQTNGEFLRQFVARCVTQAGYGSQEGELVELDGSVARSVATASGESDHVVRYRNRAGKRVALLIEDKVGAAFQPSQAERYRIRGARGVPEAWDSFITCLVAPQRYIEGTEESDWDARLALEDILNLDWGQPDGERATFKRNVLKAAIDKEHHIGPLLVDAAVTDFRQRYFELLQRDFPELRMTPPRPCYAGETWFRLRHPCLPKCVWIHHKTERGFVDLCFPNVKEADLWKFRDHLDEGMAPIQTGRSASLRLIVPKVEDFSDFGSSEPAVREGMAAALRLCDLYAREGGRLSAMLDLDGERCLKSPAIELHVGTRSNFASEGG
jgi:hypothetical protein